MSKKIIFFIGSMYGGGAERVISILANHYCELGWDVEIALLLDLRVEYELDDRIKVIDLTQTKGSYYQRLPRWLIKIRSYVKQSSPDKIVSFIGRINLLVLAACIGLQTSIIVSERNDPKHDGRGRILLNLCNWFYKSAAAVVYQTRYEQSCFSKSLKNGVIIGNPVSVSTIPQEVSRPYEIVTAGRLVPQKNQSMLIDSVALLKKDWPELTLKIYGEGQLKESLKRKINELKINEFVELCGNVSDLHKRINGAGIFVLCSEYEGLSNALIESMMLGVVPISTDYPGADELIIDGENGLIVPRGNEKYLAERIAKVFSDNALRRTLAAKALTSSEKYKDYNILKEWECIIGI